MQNPFKMRIATCLLIPAMFISNLLWAQDGKILSKTPFLVSDSVFTLINQHDTVFGSKLRSINFYRISYLSDGLKVTGYIAEPKEKGKYPCIISNRGGNRDFGQWNTLSIAFFLGHMASWKYVVIASQYRGNDGGEGTEEFGGKDIDDVLNLIPALSQVPNADTSRIGIEGASRGGMMTYLAMKNTCRFKAAVVTSGAADAFIDIKNRPGMDTFVYAELVPDYKLNKEKELEARSAVFWADKMCKTTPLLILQGTSDWRVTAAEALELVNKLYEYKHPTRFILYEGGSHGIREFRREVFAETKSFFDYYLRDGNKWPSMETHGQ